MPTPRSPRSSFLQTPPNPKARARSNHCPNNHRIFNRFPTLVFRPLATRTFSSLSTLLKKHTGYTPQTVPFRNCHSRTNHSEQATNLRFPDLAVLSSCNGRLSTSSRPTTEYGSRITKHALSPAIHQSRSEGPVNYRATPLNHIPCRSSTPMLFSLYCGSLKG